MFRKEKKLLREAVERGANLLDKRHPRWFEKIDLDAFDLASGSYCICGQLDSLYDGYAANSGEGYWGDALNRLLGRQVEETRGERYGFIPPKSIRAKMNWGRESAWSYQEGVWKREIRRRRREKAAAA